MKQMLKRKWKNLLRLLALAVCGAIVGVNVYMLNARSLVGNQLPMPFGYGAAVVLSGSMEPALSIDDLIIVKEPEQLAVDDVIVFQDAANLVVHRIVSMDGETITTKGDANNIADAPIPVSAVKGQVICALPMAGKLVNFLKTPIGTMCIIVLAIALVEIPRRNEVKKDDEERQKIIDEIQRLRNEQ